jgi:hypothetical protein
VALGLLLGLHHHRLLQALQIQVLAVAVVSVRVEHLAMAALASSSLDTLQHKALPHHLVAQTHLKFLMLTGGKYTHGQVLGL